MPSPDALRIGLRAHLRVVDAYLNAIDYGGDVRWVICPACRGSGESRETAHGVATGRCVRCKGSGYVDAAAERAVEDFT